MKKRDRNSKKYPVIKLLALALAGIGTIGAAHAQDQSPPGQQQASGVEEIIVTARKRAESVQDVPLTVDALSQQQIHEKDLTSLEKLAAMTPNFNVGRASNGSGAQITLRGIGTSSTSIGIEQSVAVIVDGAYYGQGRVINEGFFDLASMEVLKGPQALFFGKNATAGVISMKTADPGKDPEYILHASYEFESQNALLEAIISQPISDTFGIRLAVRGSKMYGGYYDNVMEPFNYPTFDIATNTLNGQTAPPASSESPGTKELLGRLTLKWTPNDALTATMKVMLDSNKVNNSSWDYSCFASPTGFSALNGYPCNGGFVTHQANFPLDIAANFPEAKSDGSEYNDYKSKAVTFNVNYVTDPVTFTWVNNWNHNNNKWACNCDFQASPITVFATENSTWDAWSSELRGLTKLDGPINGMLGVYYQKTSRDFNQYIAFANVEDSSQSPANRYIATSKLSATDGKTFSLFGQLIWSATPTIEVTAGVRYTHETKDSFFEQPYNNAAVTAIFRPADDPLGYVTANQKFNNWSPEATISWKPMDNVMLYVAYKTGYKSGGFSNSGINSGYSQHPTADLTFNPEKAHGFEAGIKSTLADNQLRLNLTAYRYDYKDLQVDFFRSDIFAFNTVTADARTQGFELVTEYVPNAVEGLNLHAELDYNHSRYVDSILPCYAGQGPTLGCTLNVGGVPYQNVDGAPTAVAPDWAGVVGGRYEMSVGGDMYVAFSGDARYSDHYLASGFNEPLSRINSYWYFDASIRFGSNDGRWELALLGKNLSNVFYVSGVVDGPSTGTLAGTDGVLADQMGFGNIPRTIALQLTTHF